MAERLRPIGASARSHQMKHMKRTKIYCGLAASAFLIAFGAAAIAFAPTASADCDRLPNGSCVGTDCDRLPDGSCVDLALPEPPRNTECTIINPSLGWVRWDENGQQKQCDGPNG